MMVSSAQRKATRKWQQKNQNKVNKYRYKSAIKHYLINNASLNELKSFDKLNHKLIDKKETF